MRPVGGVRRDRVAHQCASAWADSWSVPCVTHNARVVTACQLCTPFVSKLPEKAAHVRTHDRNVVDASLTQNGNSLSVGMRRDRPPVRPKAFELPSIHATILTQHERLFAIRRHIH